MANKKYLLPDIISYFEANGLKLVGRGYHAAVFQSRKTNEVIKVFKADKCYVMFLKCISNNSSVHFPKIKSYSALRGVYDGYHIVKMEKLEPLEETGTDTYLCDMIDEIGLLFNKKHGNTDLKDYKIDTKLIDTLKNSYPSLYKNFSFLYKNLKNSNCSLDIKSDNIMRRGDGTLVIIDPFASFG